MSERLASFISGSGTTMTELFNACLNQKIFDVYPVCVISSDPNAGGILKARNLGIPEEDILVINPRDYKNTSTGKVDQNSFGEKIIKELKKRNISLVTQNGWMPLTPLNVVEAFQGKIFNQHPAPVPEFGGKGMYGKRPHQAIIEFSRLTGRSDLWTEVVAHRVTVEYDKGAVVKSERVFFTLEDDGASLQQKALPVEHKVQIAMISDYVSGNLKEIHRESLVLPGQEEFLQQAKELAIKKYPNG